jgi:hypothetical protein
MLNEWWCSMNQGERWAMVVMLALLAALISGSIDGR